MEKRAKTLGLHFHSQLQGAKIFAALHDHVTCVSSPPLVDAGRFTLDATDAVTMKEGEEDRVANTRVAVPTGVKDAARRGGKCSGGKI
jgi:hypothetical protein